jgi:hypothetical protein
LTPVCAEIRVGDCKPRTKVEVYLVLFKRSRLWAVEQAGHILLT